MKTNVGQMAIVALAWVVPNLALARGPGGHGPMFHPGRIEALAAEVGVGDATLTKIKDLAFKAEQEAIGLRADMQRAELELKRLIDLDKPDTAQVMKQVEQVGQLETRLRKNHVQLLLAVRALLTPEQRAKLEGLVRDRRGQGRGFGGPDGEPGVGPGPGAGMRGGRPMGPRGAR